MMRNLLRLCGGLCLSAVACSALAQERPAITGIAFVRMTTADAAASAAFYRGLLGLEPGKGSSDEVAVYPVNELQRLEVETVATAPEMGRVAEIGFSTRDVKALANYLRKRGVPMLRPVHDERFEMRDPEGRLIAFVQERPGAVPVAPKAVSRRLIHSGFVVRDRAKEDAFYRDVLGFHLFWEGGQKPGVIDWANMQVPEGSDCIEYMLRQAEHPPVKQLGIMNHVAFGTAKMSDVQAALEHNGCKGEVCGGASHMGQEGKVGLNLYDPDLTRVEFIEFQPSGPNVGSPYTGVHPQEKENR